MSIAFRISVFTRPSGEKMQQSDKGNCKSLLSTKKDSWKISSQSQEKNKQTNNMANKNGYI